MIRKPMITQRSPFSRQVCVPADWTDEQVTTWVNEFDPCGTSAGWQIRRQGDEALAGDDERVPCEDRPSFVHIMLDA